MQGYKMTHAISTITIYVSADAIWQVIGDFGRAGEYLPGVVACTVAGQGVGTLRTLTSADGSTIIERLTARDADAKKLSYALLTDTPFGDCLTTIALRDLDPYSTELTWAATFQADGLPASEAVDLLDGALAENCRALKQFIEAARA
jgi:carbon monoxide dehydrogenase subunit G